ncbi:hypothetical protein Tco_0427475 [Tanacetum coccineum]
MRTRSQSRNQNRPQQQAPPVVVEPFNFEEPFDMAANGAGGAGPPPAGGGGLPVPDLRTMEELCQPSLDGNPVVDSKKNPLVLFSLGKILFPNSSMNSFLPQERQIPEMKFPTFNNVLMNPDQDSLNFAAGGNLLERRTQDVLTVFKNKSKVRNSQNKSIVSQVKSSDVNSSSSSEIAKLTHAVNQQTSAVTTAMTAILKQFQATPPPASVKAVEEICVTCGGAHPYYQCLAADGNTFLEFRDNVQGYVSAAAVNYN